MTNWNPFIGLFIFLKKTKSENNDTPKNNARDQDHERRRKKVGKGRKKITQAL